MKRTLSITFEFDDVAWVDEDTKREYPTDAVAYAMDQINNVVPNVCPDVKFINAKLDGETLVELMNEAGYVSEEVKRRERQHRAFLRKVVPRFF